MHWLLCIQGKRASAARIAELAGAGADISAYHKGGRTLAPAFAHIGTATTAADSVKVVRVNYTLGLGIVGIGAYAHFQPVGFLNVFHSALV